MCSELGQCSAPLAGIQGIYRAFCGSLAQIQPNPLLRLECNSSRLTETSRGFCLAFRVSLGASGEREGFPFRSLGAAWHSQNLCLKTQGVAGMWWIKAHYLSSQQIFSGVWGLEAMQEGNPNCPLHCCCWFCAGESDGRNCSFQLLPATSCTRIA